MYWAFQPDEPDRYKREMGLAEPGRNWGFCSDECEDVDKVRLRLSNLLALLGTPVNSLMDRRTSNDYTIEIQS